MAEEEGSVAVTVRGFSGDAVATLLVEPKKSVAEVKHLVAVECGFPAGGQQLLHQGVQLEDVVPLAALPSPLALTLVLLPFDAVAAISTAARHDRESAVRTLLRRALLSDAQEILRGRSGALPVAVDRGNETICRLLLDAAPSPAVRGKALVENHLLHQAVVRGHEGVCGLLLDAAPSPEVRSQMLTRSPQRRGKRPFCLAAEEGHEGICRVLLDSAPRPEAYCELLSAGTNDACILYLVVQRGHEAICRLLLDKAPEVRSWMFKAEEIDLALGLALAGGNEAICQVFLDISPVKHGPQALHFAARNGNAAICRMVLTASLNQEVQQQLLLEHGPLALRRAARNGHEAICQILQSHGVGRS